MSVSFTNLRAARGVAAEECDGRTAASRARGFCRLPVVSPAQVETGFVRITAPDNPYRFPTEAEWYSAAELLLLGTGAVAVVEETEDPERCLISIYRPNAEVRGSEWAKGERALGAGLGRGCPGAPRISKGRIDYAAMTSGKGGGK